MTDPIVPPENPSYYTPPSAAPPPGPPAKATPWGKIALFGCIGLTVLLLIVAVLGGLFWYLNRDDAPDYTPIVPNGDTSVLPDTDTGGVVGGAPSVYQGTIANTDLVAPDGSWYDEYPITGSIGDHYVVTMVSGDFDSYLTLTSPTGSTTSDDDGGGGTNSRVDMVLDEAGQWRIMANTLRPGDTGSYTLTIDRVP